MKSIKKKVYDDDEKKKTYILKKRALVDNNGIVIENYEAPKFRGKPQPKFSRQNSSKTDSFKSFKFMHKKKVLVPPRKKQSSYDRVNAVVSGKLKIIKVVEAEPFPINDASVTPGIKSPNQLKVKDINTIDREKIETKSNKNLTNEQRIILF